MRSYALSAALALMATTCMAAELSWQVIVPEGASLRTFYLYSRDNQHLRATDFAQESMTITVDPGTYYLYFEASNMATSDTYAYVSKEFTVPQANHLTFDLNDCVNKITVTPVLPDGNTAKCDTWRDSLRGFDTDGNVTSLGHEFAFLRDGYTLTSGRIEMSTIRHEEDGSDIDTFNSLYTNNLDEDITIAILSDCNIKDTKENALIFFALPGNYVSGNMTLRNTPDNYVAFDANYGELADIPLKAESPFSRYSTKLLRGNKIADLFGSGRTSQYASKRIMVNINNVIEDRLGFLFRYGNVPAMEFLQGGSPDFQPITSYPITFEGGKPRFNAFISDDLMIYSDLMNPEEVPTFSYSNIFSTTHDSLTNMMPTTSPHSAIPHLCSWHGVHGHPAQKETACSLRCITDVWVSFANPTQGAVGLKSRRTAKKCLKVLHWNLAHG